MSSRKGSLLALRDRDAVPATAEPEGRAAAPIARCQVWARAIFATRQAVSSVAGRSSAGARSRNRSR